eukprot:6947405-Prymnesium_polylepis.1
MGSTGLVVKRLGRTLLPPPFLSTVTHISNPFPCAAGRDASTPGQLGSQCGGRGAACGVRGAGSTRAMTILVQAADVKGIGSPYTGRGGILSSLACRRSDVEGSGHIPSC